ncbi:MAG: hypothetical protein IAG10_20990 [Planctomycetaceae bacterium]|nr:hypothetical protein [Planctomycetaceae bacterium]
MIATNGTWKRFSLSERVEQSLPREYASETRDGAQGLDNSAEVAEQHKTVAGSRIEKWPQFFLLWQIIGCVSAYDAYLAMKYQESLVSHEQNLLGRLLLLVNDGDPALFLGVKFMGTMMVLGILVNLYHSRPQRGLVIAKGVAAYQIGLLAYLTFC